MLFLISTFEKAFSLQLMAEFDVCSKSKNKDNYVGKIILVIGLVYYVNIRMKNEVKFEQSYDRSQSNKWLQ